MEVLWGRDLRSNQQMIKRRPTSVVILITLAELAWLAALGLLFVYRGKVGELGDVRRQLHSATNKFEESVAANQVLRERLALFEKVFRDVTPEEAARRLAAASDSEKKIAEAEGRWRESQRALLEKTEAEAKTAAKLATMQNDLAKLRTQLAAFPPNAAELDERLRRAEARAAELEKQLAGAQADSRKFADTLRQREAGEFSVRRELTGLPDGNLKRVIFLVDTSTSMRTSPAWASARKLMRTWLEFLPVEECALVSFNDKAVGFPKDGYHRVRQPDGTKLAERREEILRVFDETPQGTYTDLLLGLRRAYEYPAADVIVLFTDGHPHVSYQSDSSTGRDVFKEVAKHPRIPVLTVALGSYEIEGAGGPRPRTNAPISFLKELARQTGGSFLAR